MIALETAVQDPLYEVVFTDHPDDGGVVSSIRGAVDTVERRYPDAEIEEPGFPMTFRAAGREVAEIRKLRQMRP